MNENFQAIGLDWYPNSTPTNVRNYQMFTGVTYPLCINAAAERATYQAYEANDVSMVIDQSGIVRYRGAGVQASEISTWIDNLLATGIKQENKVPQETHLYQNYPNPFNPATNISFELSENEKVLLQIFNIEGRLIKTLVDNQMFAGKHELSWNGLDNSAQPVASGIYFYVLKTARNNQIVKQMILLR